MKDKRVRSQESEKETETQRQCSSSYQPSALVLTQNSKLFPYTLHPTPHTLPHSLAR
ncbi:hypothetical protein K9N68_23320 [Kovacikia minuta CCNUW1]|uniref:hypothetical protein n=1 Tax=Kovacikia minuta TaxID=2931930 RepID=UPI001CC99224|nr:hypothetical protein [Kovacikia minuta]UBF24590.1 hypothetical protein K9N68_23320 [Kovacikia minuta CCNUW1]